MSEIKLFSSSLKSSSNAINAIRKVVEANLDSSEYPKSGRYNQDNTYSMWAFGAKWTFSSCKVQVGGHYHSNGLTAEAVSRFESRLGGDYFQGMTKAQMKKARSFADDLLKQVEAHNEANFKSEFIRRYMKKHAGHIYEERNAVSKAIKQATVNVNKNLHQDLRDAGLYQPTEKEDRERYGDTHDKLTCRLNHKSKLGSHKGTWVPYVAFSDCWSDFQRINFDTVNNPDEIRFQGLRMAVIADNMESAQILFEGFAKSRNRLDKAIDAVEADAYKAWENLNKEVK